MHTPSRDGAGPSAIAPAPARHATPLPGSFGLARGPTTVTFDGGSVVMGGAPLRLLRLAPRAQQVVARWATGNPVGDHRAAQRLARRLVSSGAFNPRPPASTRSLDQVTVVIPVRDRTDQLARLLGRLEGCHRVVVDDASADGERCRDIVHRHAGRYERLPVNRGPAAARNAGLALVDTPLVAFVDSDCLPEPGWLDQLLPHFDDPLVAAVAPRIVPAAGASPSWLATYEAVRSSLDRGTQAGLVRPLSPIPYVPSTALVLRRELAIGPDLFDPRLRSGEDVDLVWRLVEAGWDVRYEPESSVAHQGPGSPAAFLSRRAFYGTSAAALSQRHPRVMAPVHTSAWSAGTWALAATRRPVLAAGVLGLSVVVLAGRLSGLVDQPYRVAGTIAAGGTLRSAVPALSGLTRAWSPALVVALLHRRTRRAAAAALLVPALSDWHADPGALDPVRYAALHVADDAAYGAGVWLGCLRARTVRPLVPRITWRTRVWSSDSLRTSLGDRRPTEDPASGH